ncbi:conserved hypothetical protein [Mucor ambiguus]|uniref:BZIP domain-containing protein n=1 Tax=Mucor ambiguus TaxID=91626 RepID=A0A0C9LU16_9FUNG|nr:conserved hypothetical protein [Mucor ambiguus]
MAGNVIGTSSYSEAMDLSDLEEDGYDHNEDMYHSPEASPAMNNMEQQQAQQQQQESSASQQQQEPPVKVRKKPGRKPNPASPALRKAQNRAAQRAFRERKERHMKELESNIKGIKDHRDKLLQDNEKMSSENEILKAENWYLKGIVLSLQLVCLQHNLVIPQHCPHVNDETLSVLAQSIPESISSYLNVNSRNKLQISQKLMNESPELSNLHLQSQPSQQQPYPQQPQQQQPYPQQPQQQQPYSQQPQQQPFPQQFPSGSLIITQDGVHKVPNKHGNGSPHQQHHASSWYHQQNSRSGAPSNQPQHPYSSSNMYGSPNSAHMSDEFSNIPPLSPMSSSSMTDRSDNANRNIYSTENSQELPRPSILAAPSEPIISNLAAIQTLRLRLRLQSACVRMQSIPFAIQPTLLQLTIPHDPRIDLIPTPHMRDRMILYRDQFDLDDCFRCLLSGSVFHGGDPAVAGNWQLPEEFFKKYWFLTIDYNLRRHTNEWRKKQGLKEINGNIPTLEESAQQQQQSSSVDSSASSQFNPPLPMSVPPPQTGPAPQHIQPSMYAQPPPALQHTPQPMDRRSMTYDDLSNYLGMQLNGSRATPATNTSTATTASSSTNLTPVQLTNGYGNIMESTSHPQPKPQSAWESLIGSRNYDMMMTGSYNKNDMDQGPN